MVNGFSGSGAPKIGDPVLRREDLRLITGQGRFSDDIRIPDQVYAVMVRSPLAHATIKSINLAEALQVHGVITILTGAHALEDGLQPIPHSVILKGLDIHLQHVDGEPFTSEHRVLPIDKVRYLGEPVAMVVAESLHQAIDAAELVDVAYEALPLTIRAGEACRPDAALVHDDAGSNVALDATVGMDLDVSAAFEAAAHVIKLKTWVQRVTGVPMEPRAAVAMFDPVSSGYTLMAGSGNVVRQKRELAAVLAVPEDCVRVIAPDVGGNFGTRNAFYSEFGLIAWASRKIGRPVQWTCDRSEAFLSDYQGRDLEVEAELALDRDGTFLALRSANTSNIGAYSVSFGPLTKGVELMTSVYDIACAQVRARAVFTNTPPTNSYRSSGRPEAMFVIERLIDMAARECGIDRIDLRRRNLIARSALPFTNPLGLTYDSGAYEDVMDLALKHGGWATFEHRRLEAKMRGMLRGIGVANYIEIASGIPRERAEITVQPDGEIEIVIGTLSSGQGHETSFCQLITDWFSVRMDQVRLVTGDTNRVSVGGGSHAGRSMRLASVVMGKASAEIIERARNIACCALECASSDLTWVAGRFTSKGSGQSLSIFDIAGLALASNSLPTELRGPLSAVCDEVATAAGFPFGSHVCEVEIDPETGALEIVNYVAVDDVGRAVNPLILHGQAHGGIAQGVGQALFEACVYDAGGQLLSGSFMDYSMPRASSFPNFTTVLSEVPATTNPLGIRAGGEGGTTPALAVMVNAIVDALSEYGVTHMEMPVTSASIWRAINQASQS